MVTLFCINYQTERNSINILVLKTCISFSYSFNCLLIICTPAFTLIVIESVDSTCNLSYNTYHVPLLHKLNYCNILPCFTSKVNLRKRSFGITTIMPKQSDGCWQFIMYQLKYLCYVLYHTISFFSYQK